MSYEEVAIIGGGSWATALAKIVSGNVKRLHWYIYEKEIIEYLKKHRHNPQYISSIEFDTKKIEFYNDVKSAMESAPIIIFVVPSAYIKNLMGTLDIDFTGRFFVSAVKGIVPDDNVTVTEYFQEQFSLTYSQVGVISGPCHAEEIAMGRLSYLTVAAEEEEQGERVASLLKSPFIKTILSSDIYGIEFGAVLKNIYALGAGINHGLGYGDNFQAVYISNAIREMERFLARLFERERHLFHSVYLGDLLVTAYSQFSRNRTFGNMIGKGYSVRSAMMELNMVAEGYYASKCIYEINQKYNVRIPIAETVYRILYENANAAEEVKELAKKLK
ncbi:MAG: NAD(P)H-dependent glycerol-3-phosphate dehydrogenase [Bacteroidales bacterium]|nr:NAD(P)H-dependent glycerol-3-phosphate dehydrogenase [Bacteroidales bacterium]